MANKQPEATRQGDWGFALIEVLVGLSILTVAFLGTMRGMFFSLRLNETNEETSRGVQMARAVTGGSPGTPRAPRST